MVQVIENRSHVEGDLLGWEPTSSLPGFGKIEILVRKVMPVEAFPNLLGEAAGQRVQIYVPERMLLSNAPTPGTKVAGWVRKGGPVNLFADPNHFSMTSG